MRGEHQFVDDIPESEVPATQKLLRALVDPAELALLSSEDDDERESEPERISVGGRTVDAALADPDPDDSFEATPPDPGLKRVLFRPAAVKNPGQPESRDRDLVEGAIELRESRQGDVKRIRFVYEPPDVILHIRNRREACR
jgi:hypothetical protein